MKAKALGWLRLGLTSGGRGNSRRFSYRASVQESSMSSGRIICRPAIKNDSSALLSGWWCDVSQSVGLIVCFSQLADYFPRHFRNKQV